MEAIAVTVAVCSFLLVSINSLSIWSKSVSSRRSRTPEEELGAAARRYLENQQATKAPSQAPPPSPRKSTNADAPAKSAEIEKKLANVLAKYLSAHENEFAKDVQSGSKE